MDNQDWTEVKVKGVPKRVVQQTVQPKVSNVSQHLSSIERKIEAGEKVVQKKLSIESKFAIIQLRVDKKLSQDQVNQMCGFPKYTLRDIENGKVVPTGKQLTILQKFYGISLKLV